MTTFNTSVHGTDHKTLRIEILRFTMFICVEFKGLLLDSKGGGDFKNTVYVNPTADQNLDEIQEELFATFPTASFYDARETEVAR